MRRTETPKPIWLKFCLVVDIPDLVTYTNFGDHRLRGFWLAGGQISPSPIDFHRRPYNTLALPCERVIHAKLELITDPDMYFMSENSMRSGIATISHRHAQANSPLVDGYYSSKPLSWLSYTDCNNLYGGAMRQPLPWEIFAFFHRRKLLSLI